MTLQIKAVVSCVFLIAAAMCALIGGWLPMFTWKADGSSGFIPSEVNGGGKALDTAQQVDIYLFKRVITSSAGTTTAVYANPHDISWECNSVRDKFGSAMAFTTMGWIVGIVALLATLFGPHLVAPSVVIDKLFCGYPRAMEFVGASLAILTNIVLVIVWNLALSLRVNVQCSTGDDTMPDGNFYSGNTFKSSGYKVTSGLELLIAAWVLSLVAVFLHVLMFTESGADQQARITIRRFR